MADESNKNTEGVILRLDRSRTDRAFGNKESLWNIEIFKIEQRLLNQVHTLESKEEKTEAEKPLLSIAIFGSPGSGKTSLLRTFVEQVRNGGSEHGGKYFSLPVIKPNIVAKDEHFLYKFLATALDEDRKSREGKDRPYRESSILSEIQQAFQEVSEYLQVINEKERSQEDDPLGISLERLERHESEVLLVEKMDAFINKLADNFGDSNTLVLMPVDDADMSMDTLISAIGTYWRYLQHPRLVPIFTFTGRLAEELLRVHFEVKLTIGGRRNQEEKLKEAATTLMMTENMALQYLGKLFPVRNRIRLGPASARVLGAKYESPEYENKTKSGETNINSGNTIEVFQLLETVSRLLFGHTLKPIVPSIRPPLRMVTLRRQIQIVDAMQAAGIERFIPGLDKTGNPKKSNNGNRDEELVYANLVNVKSWAQTFDLATWSLLNSHRDVLKEINMNLDDLYSWTPMGLRQVVLDSILMMDDPTDRRKLLKHWRYRTEDRRSQIISLLAANVFRPRMLGEEPTGDDPGAIRIWRAECNEFKKYIKNPNKYEKAIEVYQNSFSVRKGLIWFMNLCIGFYLPQILACSKPGNETVSGVGWDLVSGPVHAIREAVKNGKAFSTGMFFLNTEKFAKLINKEDRGTGELRLFTHIWCFYGYEEGRPWASVSLWRGLGLMAQLLKMYEQHEKNKDSELEGRIRTILKRHIGSTLVMGNLPSGEVQGKVNFKKWDTGVDNIDVKAFLKWLKSVNPKKIRISPMESSGNWEKDWKKCFIRRMHGENIMSTLWQDLENCYFRKSASGWNAKDILDSWQETFEAYWEDSGKEILDVLTSCPIWSHPGKDGWKEVEIDLKRFEAEK